jgi:hypothetical protein
MGYILDGKMTFGVKSPSDIGPFSFRTEYNPVTGTTDTMLTLSGTGPLSNIEFTGVGVRAHGKMGVGRGFIEVHHQRFQ